MGRSRNNAAVMACNLSPCRYLLCSRSSVFSQLAPLAGAFTGEEEDDAVPAVYDSLMERLSGFDIASAMT